MIVDQIIALINCRIKEWSVELAEYQGHAAAGEFGGEEGWAKDIAVAEGRIYELRRLRSDIDIVRRANPVVDQKVSEMVDLRDQIRAVVVAKSDKWQDDGGKWLDNPDYEDYRLRVDDLTDAIVAALSDQRPADE